MKLVGQLIVPIVLGLAAAAIHYSSFPTAKFTYCQSASDIDVQFADNPEALSNQIQESEPYLKEIEGAIPWDKRGVLLGMPVSRALKAQSIIFETDIGTDRGITAGKDRVAVNVALADIPFEPEFLRVGETIGFVVEQADEATGKTSFRLLKPFKVLAVANVVTESLSIGSEDRPTTICIESDANLADLQEFLHAMRDETIVAIAFHVD
jgi:hypothetical protein